MILNARNDAGDVERRLFPERFDADLLAGQRALDEHRLTFDARDASAFLIERLDRDARVHLAGGKARILRSRQHRPDLGR